MSKRQEYEVTNLYLFMTSDDNTRIFPLMKTKKDASIRLIVRNVTRTYPAEAEASST